MISTNPPAVRRTSKANGQVYCSAGRQQTVVPTSQGLNAAVAGATLQAAHLRVGNADHRGDATVKPAGGLHRAARRATQIPGARRHPVRLGGPEMATVPRPRRGDDSNRPKAT